jgi:hypothetical protein
MGPPPFKNCLKIGQKPRATAPAYQSILTDGVIIIITRKIVIFGAIKDYLNGGKG